MNLLSEKDRDLFYHDKCDKFDKSIALFAGVAAGLIDSFFVGNGIDSKLGRWSTEITDKAIVFFARHCPKGENWGGKYGEDEATRAIGFLQRRFGVNYDQKLPGEVGDAAKLSSKKHHIQSLAHSPDLIGLVFSVIDQFQGQAHFVINGEIVVVETEQQDLLLYGKSLPAKIFCATINWLGHIMSDVGGSYESRSKYGGRGAGIGLPFYNLFLFCDFGSIKTPEGKQSIAEIASTVYGKGYDFRAGIAMAVPVLIMKVIIDAFWMVKHLFYHKRPLKECIPTARHDDLRMMHIIGNATFCLVDLTDAAIRSRGSDIYAFIMHINYVGWCRLYKLVVREIFIKLQLGIDYIEMQYQKADEMLSEHIAELEAYDIEAAKMEVAMLRQINEELLSADTEEACAEYLYMMISIKHLELPFSNHTEFVDFMNSNETLVL